jgi:hypothetical protein
MCVYLDLTHIPRHELDRKLGGILEIYEKFQGVDPREEPMKIFPAVHYSMGGLWVDYEANGEGGLLPGSPRNQSTNVPGLYAIGECDYQYHGANRLGANSLLSCIFSGLFVGPGIVNWMISGLQRLLASGGAFTPSEGSMRILRHYQESTMNVSLFVKEYAQENQGEFPSSVLYAAYTAFCERNEYIPVNTKDFSSQLQAAKCIRTRKRSGVTYRLPTVQATV